MDPFPTRRKFPDPGNFRDLPGVARHTPIPVRETPLEGTKMMLCPKDETLKQLVSGRAIEVILPSRTAKIMGILAMAFAIWVHAAYWIDRFFDVPWVGFAFNFVGLGVFHLLVVFSQILSSGRNRPGVWAIIVLYGGIVVDLLVDWLLA
jgi:hypothetical protein